MYFALGDVVRIVGLPSSEWQNSRGTIVEVLPRHDAPQEIEYALDMAEGCRRWFLGRHLTRSIPEKLVRFFRSQVLESWQQLDPNGVELLTGDRDGLIHFLQDNYGFSTARARAEVDEFFNAFENRLKLAGAPIRSAPRAAA